MSAASHTTTSEHAGTILDAAEFYESVIKCGEGFTETVAAVTTDVIDAVEALRVRAAAADNLADALRPFFSELRAGGTIASAIESMEQRDWEALAAYDSATTQTKDGT